MQVSTPIDLARMCMWLAATFGERCGVPHQNQRLSEVGQHPKYADKSCNKVGSRTRGGSMVVVLDSVVYEHKRIKIRALFPEGNTNSKFLT